MTITSDSAPAPRAPDTWLRRIVGWMERTFLAVPILGRTVLLIGRNWWRISELRRLMWACRAQMLSVLVGGGLIAFTDQARDIVIASAAAKGGFFNKVGLVATLVLWAGVSWYWARVTLNFSFVLLGLDADKAKWNALDDAQKAIRGDWREYWRLRIPRLIGSGSIVLVAVAFLKAGIVYAEAGSASYWMFFVWAGGLLVLSLVFYWLTAHRTQIMEWMLGRAPGRFTKSAQDGGPGFSRHFIPKTDLSYDRLRDYDNPVAVFFLTASLLLAPIMSTLFALHPIGMSERFGDAVRAVLFGLGIMVPIVSLLVLMAQTFRVPLFGLTVVWMLFSLWVGDNHDVRTLATSQTREEIDRQAAAQLACGKRDVRKAAMGRLYRPALDEALDDWLAVNAGLTKPVAATNAGTPVVAPPLIMVATAGGASRAAYWTSQVLGEIAARENDFADRLFMISSVSGGSLGATAFRSLVEARRRDAAAAPPVEQFAFKAQGFLEHDFLTPALGTGLYVDLPLHAFWFLPASWKPDDRAAALEKAWESYATGMVDLGGSKAFSWSDGFIQTFEGERPWPILALNGTSVEKGKRIIFSNADFNCTNLSSQITRYDGVSVLGSDVPISTAVTMSARFPVVSPTGGMRDRLTGTMQMRVIDGGLFENFGAVTADEVLRHFVERRSDFQAGVKHVVPMAILISSDPSLDPLDDVTNTGLIRQNHGVTPPAYREMARPDCDGPTTLAPGNHWPECNAHPSKTATLLVDPLMALYDGRVARGEMAASALADRIAGSSLQVRDRLVANLVRAQNAEPDKKAHDVAMADVKKRLGTADHLDFFHFRQCRVPGKKSPTMSWHDSDDAWEAMHAMIGLDGDADPCGNAAEFFRLCTRLARLTGAAGNDYDATAYCATKERSPGQLAWRKPKNWECLPNDPGVSNERRVCGVYK